MQVRSHTPQAAGWTRDIPIAARQLLVRCRPVRADQSKVRRPQRGGAVQRVRAAVIAAAERRTHERQLTHDPVVADVFGLDQGLRQHAWTCHAHSSTVR